MLLLGQQKQRTCQTWSRARCRSAASWTYRGWSVVSWCAQWANGCVEEAMIAANACCADLLAEHVGHGIFNVHRAFEADKAEAAQEFLASQEIEVALEALTELPRYKELKRELEGRDDAWLDHRLRRFQGFTSMCAKPGPHFGLGLPAYATWTSPIRKYGDMVNHRLIKRVLKGEQAPAEASQALMDWAFKQGIEEVFAVARPRNERAIAVARRLGMEWVGETEKYYGMRLQVFRLRPG